MVFKRFEIIIIIVIIIIINFFPCIRVASYYCLFNSEVSNDSERGVDKGGG